MDSPSEKDYQIVIYDTEFMSVPEHFYETPYEFILVDFQCDGAENILINNENKLMNYHWILLDMQSSEVCTIVGNRIHLNNIAKLFFRRQNEIS